MECSKIIVKKLVICTIFVLSLLGFGQTIAFASGVINWSGSGDVAETINNLNQIEAESKKLVQKQLELKALPSDINNLYSIIRSTPVAKGSKWTYGDFTYDNQILTGLSVQGESKNIIGNKEFSLPSINPTTGNYITIISDSAFKNKNFNGNLIIPNTIKTIKSSAFSYNNFSGVLVIPKSVINIERMVFYNNSFNGTLTIPNSVTNIGTYAFAYNNFSGSLTIPSSIKVIESSTFSNNSFTNVLVIPTSITSIGNWAFRNNKINEVKLPNHTNLILDPFDTTVKITRY